MKTSNHDHKLTTELNFELYFVTEVLKLRSLHYGYWDEERSNGRLDLDEIQRAQSRFTERLISFVPPETKTILDVGAGIGDNARALSRSGHRVTAISPDRNHERYRQLERDLPQAPARLLFPGRRESVKTRDHRGRFLFGWNP